MPLRAGVSRSPQPKACGHAAFPRSGRAARPDLAARLWRDAREHTGGSNGRIMTQRLEPASVRLYMAHVG